MNFLVEKEIEFDAGHRVPQHAGQCQNPHGHRYKVVVGVSGPLRQSGATDGMVIDFADIKRALVEVVHDPFDHGFIVQRTDHQMAEFVRVADTFMWKVVVVEFPPTAEELARYFYEQLANTIRGVKVEYVQVHETPTSAACYPWYEVN